MYLYIHMYILLVMPSLKKPIDWWKTLLRPLILLQMQSDLNCIPKWSSFHDRRRGYTVMFIVHGRRQRVALGLLLRPMYLFLPRPPLPLLPSSVAPHLHLQWFYPTIRRRLRTTYRVGKLSLSRPKLPILSYVWFRHSVASRCQTPDPRKPYVISSGFHNVQGNISIL